MAAGLGFKTFTTGEVLTAADVNGYLMQGVLVFASEAARDAAITSPQDGQFAFTKDNNSLWYYSGAAWVASGATGDIEGVTAGTGISGGGTSGTVTITNSMATEIDAKGDLVVGTNADSFARLGVGANGTVLTAASGEATGLEWAAPGGGGAMTFITGATLTAASTWNFPNDTFTSTYRNYLVVMEGRDSANNDAIYWYFRASGTNNSSSNVRFAVDGRIFDNGTFSQASTAAAYFLAGYPGPYGGAYTATIYAPQVATYTQVTGNGLGTSGGTTEGATTNFAAFVNATTQYDAMGFTMSGNSYTGTYRVYGLGDA
jgi:hypothetical protein